MIYSILIYGETGSFDRLPEAAQGDVMAGHKRLQAALDQRGDFVSMKLMPPSSAVTVEPAAPETTPLVVDGPFSETKESFLGFYAADFRDLDDALEHARMLASPIARIEVRPVAWAGGMIQSEVENVGVA